VPDEIAWLEALPEPDQAKGGVLIFAAKEAFYKCQYPLTREWLGFHDVVMLPVEDGFEQGRFTILTLRSAAISARAAQFVGRFRFADGFVLAGVSC
jgi:4'-phosphopantetheinyl transferase EntD